jgi:hypothetical protein
MSDELDKFAEQLQKRIEESSRFEIMKFKGPDYHRNECVKSNFSAGFVAISGMPSLYSESGNDMNHVPVEVDPNLHLEPREQVRTVVQKIHFYASHSLKNPVNLFQQRMMLKYVIFVGTQVMKRCLLSVACVMMVPNTLTACQVC